MTDNEILRCIQAIMSGAEWSADTLDDIAEVLNANGYAVADLDDADLMADEVVK